MTLSAKQIIADRETTDESSIDAMFLAAKALNNREARLPALEDFFLSMQPRPIEEAPKDGTRVLGVYGEVKFIARWSGVQQLWIGEDVGLRWPSHFIPLDALPLPEGE